jgi:hypothetical protein
MTLLNDLAWVAVSGLFIIAFGVAAAALDPFVCKGLAAFKLNGLAAFKRKRPPLP